MKQLLIAIGIMIAILGCAPCKRCYGQSLDFGSDLIISATEAQNFKGLILDYANRDLNGLADALVKVALGGTPTGQTTVTINAAQNNRWLNKADKGSFASLAIYNLLRDSINRKQAYLSAPYIQEATATATLQINNQGNRTRFISRFNGLYSPETY